MDLKNILCKGVSEMLAPVHFILQTSADSVAALEGKLISLDERYDYDKVYRRRKQQTEQIQKGCILTIKILKRKMNSIFASEEAKDIYASEIIRLQNHLKELEYPKEFKTEL